EALYLTSLEKRFNPAITHEPRYIGKTSSIGTSTGIANIQISSSTIRAVQAQRGDWVAYTGPNSGIWENGLLMRWTGFAWEQVNPDNSDNTHLYQGALKDIFEGAPNARYSVAFIKTLFAQTVNTEFVNVRTRLRIGPNNDGIEIDGNTEQIKSSNYVANSSGFMMRKIVQNGVQAEFTNIKTRNMEVTGNLNANVSMFGWGSYALSGGIRDYISFYVVNNNISVEDSSWDSGSTMHFYRLSTGRYRILFPYSTYDMARRMAIIGMAQTNDVPPIGLFIIKSDGGSIPYFDGVHVVNRAFAEFEIRTPSGTLADPFYACILFAG
ncbi:MAG: hypothetical protein FWD40_12155, partial [Treponema sp.]|nr:hypothetical protein [Treponema sp.]